MDKTIFDRISARIDTYEDEIIRIQQELTSRPALSPENGGDGEAARAEFLKNYLSETIKCDELNDYAASDSRLQSQDRPNLIGRIRGKNAGRTLWIISHMDVVPAGPVESWRHDPYQVKVEDGKIYGRGTEDNQQGIVSSLIAAKALRDESVEPEIDLALLLVADEETGSTYGIQHVLKNHPNLLKKEDLILIPDSGNEDGSIIEVAEKSILWFKIHVIGQTTHASTPEKGINALNATANLLVKLNNLYVIFSEKNPLFDPPISTFEPTRMERTVDNVNTIPGEVTFYFDCRLLPDVPLDRVRTIVEHACEAVETRYKVKTEISTVQEVDAAPQTAEDAPIVKALDTAISQLRGIQPAPMGIGGGTVASFFRRAGFPVAVWATQDETLHKPNEYSKISNIIADAKVFAHIALQ